MSSIRILSEHLVNQIAAGEVVERPASVVKELIENALDSVATRIEIKFEEAGKKKISVFDNGQGMSLDDLHLAIERHATSKLTDENLEAISTFGFRGEALPSIAAVSRMRLTSRTLKGDHGWCLPIEYGVKNQPTPVAFNPGTCVEVEDLFARVPARLKFLKTDRTERAWIIEMVERISLAHPYVHWILSDGDRICLDLPAFSKEGKRQSLERWVHILDPDAADHLLTVDQEDLPLGLSIKGYISLPTYHKTQSQQIYTYVNGRSVKDKTLLQSIRVGYQDVLAQNRYPVVLLMLQVPYGEVDVNVHPAKTEVRFQNPQDIRRFVIRAIRKTLEREGHRSAGFLKPPTALSRAVPSSPSLPQNLPLKNPSSIREETSFYRPSQNFRIKSAPSLSQKTDILPTTPPSSEVLSEALTQGPLGEARAQTHRTYIIAQTPEGMVVVDQHAAHERIIYEDLKKKRFSQAQILMIPEVVSLRPLTYDALLPFQKHCQEQGLIFESFGSSSILVREIPSVLTGCDVTQLIKDMAECALEHQGVENMEERIDHIYATMACHGSIRAGRTLNLTEMNGLLRRMEESLMTGQCNHGRPTYLQWTRSEMDRLFGRS